VQEGIAAGQKVMLWVMDTDETLEMTALDAIPLGHKIALKDLAAGDTVINYAHDVGRIVAPVKRGGHVHTHNRKPSAGEGRETMNASNLSFMGYRCQNGRVGIRNMSLSCRWTTSRTPQPRQSRTPSLARLRSRTPMAGFSSTRISTCISAP
jgi:(2R)-sulfolactate sulfo-lyase subunit alpha